MIRISLPFIVDIFNKLEALTPIPDADTEFSAILFQVFEAKNALSSLIEGSLFAPYLRVSFGLGKQLLDLLDGQMNNSDFNRTISRYEIWLIKNAHAQYRTALLAELGSLNSYFVTQKAGYDTVSLLTFGENLFPPDLANKVPEAIIDVKEAAKCLAFEISTACGFHAFRATESVLRRYYAHVTGGAAAPKVRSLGVYIAALAGSGDAKVLAALKQMTDLHRNPLVHPETVLTIEEAISILGVARSAIGAMLAVLPIVPPTTTTLLTSP